MSVPRKPPDISTVSGDSMMTCGQGLRCPQSSFQTRQSKISTRSRRAAAVIFISRLSPSPGTTTRLGRMRRFCRENSKTLGRPQRDEGRECFGSSLGGIHSRSGQEFPWSRHPLPCPCRCALDPSGIAAKSSPFHPLEKPGPNRPF